MRITKKAISLILAVMMIASLFVAVPATASATTTAYVKVTSAPSDGDWSGDYLIVYEDGSKAFNGGSSGLNSQGNYIGVTIDSGVIASDDDTDAAKVTIAQIDGGYSIKAANDYIGGLSGKNYNDTSNEAILNTISLEDNSAKIVSDTSVLRFNTSWGFRYYKSASYATQQPIQLYKLTGGSAPAPAKLILNVGENGTVVMNNGIFGNVVDAGIIENIAAEFTVTSGTKINIDDGHSANLVEGGSINIATGGEVSFYPSADNTGVITAIPDEGYICTGWYNGDTLYSSDAALSYQSISEDMTLTAKFAPAPTYTVTWKNGDTVLETDTGVAKDSTPSYDGATPTKPLDENGFYTFSGWSPAIGAVTEDVTYTAQFDVDPWDVSTAVWDESAITFLGKIKASVDVTTEHGTALNTFEISAAPTETVGATCEEGAYKAATLSITLSGNEISHYYKVYSSGALGHDFSGEPEFNWTQDANGEWNCNKLIFTCTGCDETDEYEVTGFFGASAVTCTANSDGSFTYSVSKKVDGTTYTDSKTVDAGGVIKTSKQLTAAAKIGGEWELGNDIEGVVGVVCADGFELDGNGFTVTRSSSVDTNPVFRITANPAEVTLKNLTIDGIAGRSNTKPAVATKMSNPSAGNVLNLENVTIANYDFDQANNGVVLAWGQSTVNMKDCTVDTDSTYDVWGGAASTVNVDGGELGTVYLNGGTSSAALTNGADVDTIEAQPGSTIATDDPSIIEAPEGFEVQSNGNGTYSIIPKEYVAQVGTDKYESLQDALDVTPDGGTVTVLQDITTSGNIFADGYVSGGNRTYTVDLGGYTVSGGTFIVADGNDVTFTNGTIESASYAIQNTATATIDSTTTVKSTGANASAVYGDVGSSTIINGTVEGNKYGVIVKGGDLEVSGKVTATNSDGRAIALRESAEADINDGADVEGNYGVIIYTGSTVNVNGGEVKGVSHAISGNGTASDGPYTINVTGGSVTATNGAGIYNPNAQGTLKISGGNITGSTTAVAAGTNSTNIISGGTFSSDVDVYAAPGFVGKQLSATTFGVEVDNSSPLNPLNKAASAVNDNNAFGLKIDYLMGTLLGVQKKSVAGAGTSSQETRKDMRFVACLDTDIIQSPETEDYGFVLAKVSSHTYDTIHFENLRANAGNGEKTISCKGSYNNVCGDLAYGNPTDTSTDYKYITCGVNGVTGSEKVVARFYVKINGTYYYAKYAGHDYKYTGCLVGWDDLV